MDNKQWIICYEEKWTVTWWKVMRLREGEWEQEQEWERNREIMNGQKLRLECQKEAG